MLLTKFVWEVQLAKSVSFQVHGLYYSFDPLLHLGNLAMMWTWILAGNLFLYYYYYYYSVVLD